MAPHAIAIIPTSSRLHPAFPLPYLRPEGVGDHVQLALPEDPVPHQRSQGRGGGGSGHLLMKVLVAARDGHDDGGALRMSDEGCVGRF